MHFNNAVVEVVDLFINQCAADVKVRLRCEARHIRKRQKYFLYIIWCIFLGNFFTHNNVPFRNKSKICPSFWKQNTFSLSLSLSKYDWPFIYHLIYFLIYFEFFSIYGLMLLIVTHPISPRVSFLYNTALASDNISYLSQHNLKKYWIWNENTWAGIGLKEFPFCLFVQKCVHLS